MFPQRGARTGGMMGWRRRLREEKHSGDQRPSPEGAQMQARCYKSVETQWAPWLLRHDFHPCGHEGYWVISLRLLRVTSGLWKHGCRRLGLKGGLDNPPSWTEGFLEQTTRLWWHMPTSQASPGATLRRRLSKKRRRDFNGMWFFDFCLGRNHL